MIIKGCHWCAHGLMRVYGRLINCPICNGPGLKLQKKAPCAWHKSSTCASYYSGDSPCERFILPNVRCAICSAVICGAIVEGYNRQQRFKE